MTPQLVPVVLAHMIDTPVDQPGADAGPVVDWVNRHCDEPPRRPCLTVRRRLRKNYCRSDHLALDKRAESRRLREVLPRLNLLLDRQVWAQYPLAKRSRFRW